MVMFNLLMVLLILKDEWRYVWMGCGAQCVMTGGTTEMLKWCVDNYILKDVSAPAIYLHGRYEDHCLFLQHLFHCKNTTILVEGFTICMM